MANGTRSEPRCNIVPTTGISSTWATAVAMTSSRLLRQADSSLYWSIFRQYSLIARFNYDLEEHRTIEALAGLEYSDCCWQMRVVGRKFLSTPGSTITPDAQTDEGIFFQVVFKGLAGFRRADRFDDAVRLFRATSRRSFDEVVVRWIARCC